MLLFLMDLILKITISKYWKVPKSFIILDDDQDKFIKQNKNIGKIEFSPYIIKNESIIIFLLKILIVINHHLDQYLKSKI